jgi:hypothetical protein
MPVNHTGTPNVMVGITITLYRYLRCQCERPQTRLPSIRRPATLHAPLFAIVSTCFLKESFQSKKIPSYRSVCCATIVSVLSNVSVIIIGGEGSCLRLEKCISSDFSASKLSPCPLSHSLMKLSSFFRTSTFLLWTFYFYSHLHFLIAWLSNLLSYLIQSWSQSQVTPTPNLSHDPSPDQVTWSVTCVTRLMRTDTPSGYINSFYSFLIDLALSPTIQNP